ncbi:glycoside hydrolase family protein [Burkholderia multivorans]|uniref:glycoside hydrolase family protein n=1 Tax=Burkholderia multivorans TaxID=87883 RepID=UPI000D00CD7B|nr:glycoside hydrolase family protein [Burkholderia multivorans]PRF25602.1 calcium-binding protein [Burkholderia multivorans]
MSKTDPKKKHHPPAAPKPAQKPIEPADTPLNWAYPFTPVGQADATDPMTYFKALAKSENGFYPLGASGMWHGGVHFSHGSAEMLNQDSGVRAIADGKIVAYRLNTKYEETTYPDNTLAHYSTGFVLVRHELKLPPKPVPDQPAKPASAAPSTTPAPADSPPADSKPADGKPLVFFSLYMHTMDWETYRKAIEQAKSNSRPDPLLPVPMSYWEGERYYRVGDKAKDKQSLPKPKAPARPAGTSNDPFGNPALPDYHLDDLPSVDPAPGLPPPPPETGLNIRDLPKGKVIGVLPKGAEVIAGEGDPAHPDWIKIKAVKSGTILPAVVGQPVSPQAPWGYLFKAELDAVVDPNPLDSVVILKEPHPVKAGEVIAHVGQYQWATKAGPLPPQANYPMLHLEVFAGPDLKDFIDQSRNRAKELNDKNKPLLEIMPGAKLVSEIPAPDQQLTQAGLKLVPTGDAKASRWVKVQPKSMTTQPAKGHKKGTQTLTDVGKPLWVESRLANTVSTGNVSGWQNFPLDGAKATGPGADFRDVYRRADLDKLGAENVAIDDKGRHWWNITIGSKDGSARQGWVCETGNPLVQFRSPWEWPGFVLVDNGSVSPADMYKRFLHATEQYLADEEGTEFMGTAAKVNAGELITTLEKAIDWNDDGKVTAQELKHALETRWMAEAISHLVVRNETEWGGGLGKWEELTPLMKKQTELWKTELDRLAKLQWWEQIKGVDGFPADLSPWHVHPIGLIGNFMASGGAATTISDDGIYFIFMQEHLEGVTNRLHWPGGASGVTLGAGYDMKARTAESVVADMKAIGLDDATATAISGGAGLEKDAARDFCKKNQDVVNLSNDKQVELLHKTVPAYVRMVNKAVKVQLKQTEFDALVSYAYNPGGGWTKVTDMINRGQIPEAMAQISQYVYSGGKVFDGLVKRRKDEVTLYTTGRYEFHGQSIQHKK